MPPWNECTGGRTPIGDLVVDQREEVIAGDLLAALQEVELDQARYPADLPADPLYERGGGLGRPASSQDVVDDQHPLPGVHGVRVQLEGRGSVLERVLLGHRLGRKLPLLPD